MLQHKRIFIIALSALALSGCVSMKSYRETKAHMLSLELDKRALLEQAEQMNEQLKQLAIKYEELQKDTIKIKR